METLMVEMNNVAAGYMSFWYDLVRPNSERGSRTAEDVARQIYVEQEIERVRKP
jgi:hypothetical protein